MPSNHLALSLTHVAPVIRKRQVALPCVLIKISPFKLALRRLRFLHLVATGALVSKQHSRSAAATRHQKLLVGFFVQTIAAPPSVLLLSLAGYNETVATIKAFDGTESVFLTLLVAAVRARAIHPVEQSIALWKKLGPPRVLSAGHDVAPFYDAHTRSLSYLNAKDLTDLEGILGIVSSEEKR
jgi:hypothetical protein